MHYGRLATSPRLQRVLEVLQQRGSTGATTRELIDLTDCCAINSIVSELRANGILIDAEDEGINERGSRVFRYRLIAAGPPKQQSLF